eukprot:7411543-Pyramimonas_sp.AAC.1
MPKAHLVLEAEETPLALLSAQGQLPNRSKYAFPIITGFFAGFHGETPSGRFLGLLVLPAEGAHSHTAKRA